VEFVGLMQAGLYNENVKHDTCKMNINYDEYASDFYIFTKIIVVQASLYIPRSGPNRLGNQHQDSYVVQVELNHGSE